MFLSRCGFAPERPDQLREALLAHVRDNDVSHARQTEFGITHEVEGALDIPSGRRVFVRTVWSCDIGKEAPRLITLVPRQKG